MNLSKIKTTNFEEKLKKKDRKKISPDQPICEYVNISTYIFRLNSIIKLYGLFLTNRNNFLF